ncbi:MAG: tripartite tricarboxylate transporter TctB family protein [Clostridiales bacterium]|nr:tripartite tricarboxylate transporter TctB family protein [Clostridiales bacterium]
MKKFGSKQLIPIITALIGVVFAYIGFTQLGFWDKEPQPGFFPSIIAIVMVISSIAAFFQTLKEEGQPEYNKHEITVILGGLSIILGSFLVGMIPMLFLYVLFWLKVVEKGTPWKHVIIIEAIIAVIVLGVFAGWLQVQFPWGLFEMFM